jgi:hypothetical protein
LNMQSGYAALDHREKIMKKRRSRSGSFAFARKHERRVYMATSQTPYCPNATGAVVRYRGRV